MMLKRALVRSVVAALVAGGVLALMPGQASAQGRYRVGPNGEPTAQRRSPRGLGGAKDAAVSDLRTVSFASWQCVENLTGTFDYDTAACGPFLNTMLSGFTAVWVREASWAWSVPKTTWDSAKAKVPSLSNATGGGWTQSNRLQTGEDDLGPADGSLGLHHAGVTSTGDRSCRDHTSSFASGNPLLAGIDCPETWGTEGWKGARPVPLEVYLARFAANANRSDLFDFWKVPDADLDAAGVAPTKTIGNFQTYGFTSDYTAEILCGTALVRSYGRVIPTTSQVVPGGCAGAGAPTRQGWPLGIEVRFDAFTFQLPALKNIFYVQATFTNNSKKVYGVGLDYDSLYLSLQNGWFANSNIQQNVETWLPGTGTMATHTGPLRPCEVAREVSDFTCARWGGPGGVIGFEQGASALIVLKSPIGDQRYKLFTRTLAGTPCTPGVGFCNPAHPQRGDTFTVNQGKFCGFRACARNIYASDPAVTPDHERRAFGMVSATEANALGNRTPVSLTDQVYFHTFRNAGFPLRWAPGQAPALGGGFNRWAPAMAGANWDYNKDGIQDTLHLDTCHLNGCTVLWGDTLPSGKYSVYSNVGGSAGVGPIKLKADSVTSFVFALTTAQSNDSAGFMAQLGAAIDNYQNFFLAPDAAPKCRVTGVRRAPATPTTDANVSVTWDNTCFAGQWTDKFLDKQYNDLLAAPSGTLLARLRQLNPWLDDTLNFLRSNNLVRLHIFKSCNDGGSWTTFHNCAGGNPATGGPLADLGFLPYATFNTDDPTGIPNSFTDLIVIAGLTYTYDLVGETRGAVFTVINGDATTVIGLDTVCSLNCRTETLSLAPTLFNALSASTGDPNVARAYLAASLQAGGARARTVVVDSAGPMATTRIGVAVTNDSLTPANYRLLFGDSARATQVEKRFKGSLVSTTTRLVLRGSGPGSVGDSIVVSGTNLGGLTPSGAAAAAPVVVPGGTPDTTYTTRAYTWAAGPVAALSRRTGTTNTDALLVSNTLTGASATPGAFHANANYPQFDLSLDRTLANAFNRQFFLTPGGDTLGPLAEPTLAWQSGSAAQDQVSSSSQANGDYQFTWGAQPFGTGGVGGSDQFRLNFADPAASATAIAASLAARTAVSTGVKTDSAATAIAQSLGQPSFNIDSLVAVKLPFSVTNLSYNRPVLVAMRNRPGKTIVVGSSSDTIRVTAPNDAWVPGDTLFFIERVSGIQRVTFQRAVLGCDPSRYVRLSCNPVYPGTPGQQPLTSYLGATSGQLLRVQYHTPITAASQFTLQAQAPLRGLALASDAGAIRSGLAAVRVVPNPYVMVSQYAGNVLLFTHMPPRGVLRIYTVAGQFVQQITWNEADLTGDGDLAWNLRSREGTQIAGGLYIYVLTATDASGNVAGTRTDKFVIIR